MNKNKLSPSKTGQNTRSMLREITLGFFNTKWFYINMKEENDNKITAIQQK